MYVFCPESVFADITGFTTLTERAGAENAFPVVVGCLQVLDEIARKHGGTVEKLIGDCVMALFGFPEAMEDAPRVAGNAAIELRRYFPGIQDNVNARRCARAIAGWLPLPPVVKQRSMKGRRKPVA